MRYPVVNLRRMGGMLEDYQNEISALKAKLNPGIYSQPGPTPVYTPPPPPPGPSFPPANPITPGRGAPPMSVATGYPTTPAGPPSPPPEPYRPPSGGCPAGTTWTPTGCLPNVASEDRYIPPDYVPPYEPPRPPPNPIEPGGPTPPTSVATGYPTTPGPTPLPPPPPFTGECPPGQTMTPTGCRPNVATPGGGRGGFTLPGGLFSGGGVTASLFGLGGPILFRPIRLRGF